jgi:tRNA threonylcarbamoyladenosine biosynthesis protein TsaE
MTAPLTLTAARAADTQAIAERLGRLLAAGDVLALIGPLGAGKTTFVQGLARGVGVPPDRHVASPTFALVNQHPGRVPFVHADLYRINHPAEIAELGLSEAYDYAAAAIEWLDRFPTVAPADRLEIEISPTFDEGGGGAGMRRIAMRATGPRSEALADELAPRIA